MNKSLLINKKTIHKKMEKKSNNKLKYGLGILNNKDKLLKSIAKLYNISNVSLYIPLYDLVSKSQTSHSVFNNKYKLERLYKKCGKVFTHGSVFYGLLKKNSNNYIKRKIFIKELPSLQPETYMKHSEYYNNFNPLYPNYFMGEYNKFLYSYNNPTYIDIFANYLCSKLVENNINPHFPLFYGVVNTMFKKYSHTFTDKSECDDFKCEISSKDKNYRFIYKNSSDKYLVEISDYPVYLLASEYLCYDLEDLLSEIMLYNTDSFDKELTPIIFQTIMALTTTHKNWKLYHNDLHTGNIMFKTTNLEYVYYMYKDIYYRVPLNGKMVKIIDWDRATLEFQGVKLNNLHYTTEGNCSDMYLYPSNVHTKKNIDPNPSFDLSMLSYDIHKILDGNHKNSKILKYLYDLSNTKNGNNIISMYKTKDGGFKLYIDIAHMCNNAIPERQITKPIFKQFIVNKANVPVNAIVYKI